MADSWAAITSWASSCSTTSAQCRRLLAPWPRQPPRPARHRPWRTAPGVPGHGDTGQLDVIGHDLALFLGDDRLGHLDLGHGGACKRPRTFSTRALPQPAEVAHQHQAGVVRASSRSCRRRPASQLGGLDVSIRADHPCPSTDVREQLGRAWPRQRRRRAGSRCSGGARCTTTSCLVGQRDRVDLVDRCRPSMSLFEPKAQLQLVGGQREVVVGAVEGGRNLESVPPPGPMIRSIWPRGMWREPAEHQVPEEVGKARQGQERLCWRRPRAPSTG